MEAIRKRHSIRSYLAEEVEAEKLRELLKAAMFSPSSRGSRAWEFIVVRNEAAKRDLAEATPWAFFVTNAPFVIVICYNTGVGRRFKEDASICAEHIHLEAVNQGLGTCIVQVADAEGPHGNAEDYVKGLLGVPADYRVQFMMPVGYPAEEHPPHSDSEFDESKIRWEKF